MMKVILYKCTFHHKVKVMKKVYIYALVCPLSDEIRYIGKSTNPKARLSGHMRDTGNCHRVNWLNKLKKKGLEPAILILEEIIGEWPWQESERYWIRKGKELGWRLTNNTSGGDGVRDLPQETREKMRQTWLGRKHKESTKKLISEKTKGVPIHSEEHKEKMRKLMTGREITWGDKISESIRSLSDQDISDIKEKLSNGVMVKDLASEYGVHRTTISKVKKGTYKLKYNGKPCHNSKRGKQ